MNDSDLTAAARAAADAGEWVTNTVLDRFAPANTPAGVFDILNLDDDAIEGWTVVGGPGAKLQSDPQPGDVLLSRVRGERDYGRLGVVAGDGLAEASEAAARGRPRWDRGPGLYAELIADGAGQAGEVAARVSDHGRRLPTDRMLIRPELEGRAHPAKLEGTTPTFEVQPEAVRWEGERWPGVVHDEAAESSPEAGPIEPGRRVVHEEPVLASHRGTHPDLILIWNAMPAEVTSVDVVVHFHGYSVAGGAMRIDTDIEPKSGLDFSNPLDYADPRPGRRRPTLCLLPRGNFFGGRTGAGYDHPALITPNGLRDLIAAAIRRFALATGLSSMPATGRLILTAHAGGGAGLVAALPYNEPQELHLFDAVYGPADDLVGWAQAWTALDPAASSGVALRAIYVPGSETATHSLALASSLRTVVPESVGERFHVDATSVPHDTIPQRFGWLLLADAAARLGVQEKREAASEASGDGAVLGEGVLLGDGGLASAGIESVGDRGLASAAIEAGPDSCRAGEGPAGPEPDPTGRGPHPLLGRGVTAARSRRPSVGYAQQCLNGFLAGYKAGTATCGAVGGVVRTYIDSAIATLASRGQMPLVVDCRFGPNTELATKAFQACAGVSRDGAIGPMTWPLLEAYAPSSPSPAPVPSTTNLSSLEGRYFPPAGTTDAAPFSRASTVAPIVDGEGYFAAIKSQIDALARGDAWYIAGWWTDAGFTFRDGAKLGELLVAKASAGVDVRVILWANRQLLDHPTLAGQFGGAAYLPVVRSNVATAEDLRARTDGSGATVLAGRVLLDWSGNAASSHHMKFSVFSQASNVTAFVGGIDYLQNRLDRPMHLPPSPGWHDAGTRVEGDAANRALETFVTRWTEASTLSAATYDLGAGARQYNPTVTPPTPPTGSAVAASADTSVEVIRSFPDSKEFHLIRNTPWTTLPRTGVHEVLRTFRTAFAAAQRYIYIEDQSFNATDSLFPSLVAACKRGVKVIAVLPGAGDPLDAPGTRPLTLSQEVNDGIVTKLSTSEQQNLAVYHLRDLIVHSKLVLIDDEYLTIGSANFMDRSMEFTFQGDDSEISVAAVSTAGLVRDLRVNLWAEHLQATAPSARAELNDLSKSLAVWRPSWGSGVTFAHTNSRLIFVGPR